MDTAHQATLADLTQLMLADIPLSTLRQKAVTRVSRALAVDRCGFWELQPDRSVLVLCAGAGWQEGMVGHEAVAVGATSGVGAALLVTSPLIVAEVAPRDSVESCFGTSVPQ